MAHHLFQPGQSGNPKGRPPGPPREIKEAYQALEPLARQRLTELLDHKRPEIVIQAAKIIIERAYGKPHQTLSGPDGTEPIKVDVSGVLASLIDRVESNNK